MPHCWQTGDNPEKLFDYQQLTQFRHHAICFMQQQEPLQKPACKRCHLVGNTICAIICPRIDIKPLFHKKRFIAIHLATEYIHPPSFITNRQQR
jgi:hypothetical protein